MPGRQIVVEQGRQWHWQQRAGIKHLGTSCQEGAAVGVSTEAGDPDPRLQSPREVMWNCSLKGLGNGK